MKEYVSAVARFADDLYALGIARPNLAKAICLYINALFEPSQESWNHLYLHVSEALQQWPGVPVDVDAAQRLFALIDDDFGREILELPVRARLRDVLLQHRIAS